MTHSKIDIEQYFAAAFWNSFQPLSLKKCEKKEKSRSMKEIIKEGLIEIVG